MFGLLSIELLTPLSSIFTVVQQQPASPTFGTSESGNGIVEKQPSSLVATDNELVEQGTSKMGVDPSNGACKDPCYLGQHQVSLGWGEME